MKNSELLQLPCAPLTQKKSLGLNIDFSMLSYAKTRLQPYNGFTRAG
uniref:Uncharacterized protein n=1 Tax=Anguilla anguilla TaxID=7936 RepID=A0A0E9U2M1_ANGAN